MELESHESLVYYLTLESCQIGHLVTKTENGLLVQPSYDAMARLDELAEQRRWLLP
jgi:hypothetical protein